MRSSLLLAGTAAFATAICGAPLEGRNNGGAPKVSIKDGNLVGLTLPNWEQDLFLGIPYAQPPVGDLRLRAAKPLEKSFGTLQATAYGPHCWDAYTTGYDDNTGFENSEDCLTLNVVRPAGTSKGDDLPVLFWIHGGGLFTGGSADYRYNASGLVAASVANGKPIIFVGINYRLGAFGFTSNKPLADEGNLNLGFRDQRLALQWVQQNIAAFGGDPSKVTIQGERCLNLVCLAQAGGLSVNAHVIAFGGQNSGLFHQAISESGGYFSTFVDPYSGAQATVLQNTLGNSSCASTESSSGEAQLACLRSLSAPDFRKASASVQATFSRDGTVFSSNSISAAYKSGKFAQVPFLIGDNTDEGVSFGPQGANTTEQASALIGALTPSGIPAQYRSELLNLYPNVPALGAPYNTGDFQLTGNEGGRPVTAGKQNKRVASIAGDRFTVAGDRLVAQTVSKVKPVYKYRFNHVPWNISYSSLDYIGHFLEVSYVFNLQNYDVPFWIKNHFTATYLGEGAPIADRFLGVYMSRSWAAFAATGDPNNANVTTKITWPNYANSASNLVFQTQGSRVEQDNFRKDGIQFMIDNVFV